MGHTHSEYRHVHSEEEQKAVLNRLSRAIGHLESIKRMVEDDRDCSDVLIQLSAVRSAITNISKVVMRHHMEHCIVDAVHSDELERIEDLKRAIERFIK
jgi:DNA-binding FrmR family transcriptional regulator